MSRPNICWATYEISKKSIFFLESDDRIGLGPDNSIFLFFFLQANLGNLDKKDDCISMVTSNLALVQCQGIVVGFVASIVAVIMDFMKGGELDFDHTLLLCASAVVTASIASFLLGLVMVGVIVLSRRCKVT